MSLLPHNSKVVDQNFAEIIDIQSRVDFSDVSINPLTCDASLLPHIAFIKGANIENMFESVARVYLKNFDRKKIGTVGAVDDALKVYFDNPRIIEWFDDNSLSCGEFKVSLKVDDNCRKFDKNSLEQTKKLIKNAKNVRSKLTEIGFKYISENSSVMNIGFVCENKSELIMKNEYKEVMPLGFIANVGLACESSYYIKMEGH